MKVKKIILILFFVSFVIPNLVFASWWNPFSWFSKVEPVEKIITTTSNITTKQPKKSVKDDVVIMNQEMLIPKASTKQAKAPAGNSVSDSKVTTFTGEGKLNVTFLSDCVSCKVLSGSVGVSLGRYKFMNESNSSGIVTNLTLQTGNISNNVTIKNIQLYNNGVRITDSAVISSGKIIFNSDKGLFIVGSGSPATIEVRADIPSYSKGESISIGLTGITSSIPISAIFPVGGSTMNVI